MKISLKLLLFSCLFFAINLNAAANSPVIPPKHPNKNIETTVLGKHEYAPTITFSSDGKKLYSVTSIGMRITVGEWDLESKNSNPVMHTIDLSKKINLNQPYGFYHKLYDPSISSDGKQIVFFLILKPNTSFGCIVVWDIFYKKYTYSTALDFLNLVNFIPYSNQIISLNKHKAVTLWDVGLQHKIWSFEYYNEIYPIAINSNGNQVALASDPYANLYGHVIDLFLLAPLLHQCRIPINRGARSIAISPDGKKMVYCSGLEFCSNDGRVILCDVESERCVHEFDHLLKAVHVIFSPDGTKIAVALNDGSIVVYTDRKAKEALDVCKAQFLTLAMATHYRTGVDSPAKTLTRSDLYKICNMCMVTPWKEVLEG